MYVTIILSIYPGTSNIWYFHTAKTFRMPLLLFWRYVRLFQSPSQILNIGTKILYLRAGKTGSLFIWVIWKLIAILNTLIFSIQAFVCLTAFFVVQTALHAASRTVYAFSRDHGTQWYIIIGCLPFNSFIGLPDGGYFGKTSKRTHTPLRAIALTTVVSILPGLLDLASPIAANAIFSLTAMALDLSYIIPIFCRRVFAKHPDVQFKPGPFFMGNGLLGLVCNIICISWTCFVCVIFSFPTVKPVTPENMNYASVSRLAIIFEIRSAQIIVQIGYYCWCHCPRIVSYIF